MFNYLLKIRDKVVLFFVLLLGISLLVLLNTKHVLAAIPYGPLWFGEYPSSDYTQYNLSVFSGSFVQLTTKSNASVLQTAQNNGVKVGVLVGHWDPCTYWNDVNVPTIDQFIQSFWNYNGGHARSEIAWSAQYYPETVSYVNLLNEPHWINSPRPDCDSGIPPKYLYELAKSVRAEFVKNFQTLGKPNPAVLAANLPLGPNSVPSYINNSLNFPKCPGKPCGMAKNQLTEAEKKDGSINFLWIYTEETDATAEQTLASSWGIKVLYFVIAPWVGSDLINIGVKQCSYPHGTGIYPEAVGVSWWLWDPGKTWCSDCTSDACCATVNVSDLRPVRAACDGVPIPPTKTPTPTKSVTNTPTPVGSNTATPTISVYAPGDVNKDGKVNQWDMKRIINDFSVIAHIIEDADGNGKVNILDTGLVFSNWTAGTPPTSTPTKKPTASPTNKPTASPTPKPTGGATSTPRPTSPPGTGIEIYGARYASAASFWDLARVGILNPNTVIFNGPNPYDPGKTMEQQIDNIISTSKSVAVTYPGFKPSIFMWDSAGGGWPFTCTGISAGGRSFINYMNQKNYWGDVYAINGLHEPMGSGACSTISQMTSVIAEVKSLSGGRAKIIEKLFSDNPSALQFVDGICDYCAVLYHPFGGGSSLSTLAGLVKRDIDTIKGTPSVTTDNKFVPWVAAIYFPGYLYMPTPSEMRQVGDIILNTVSPGGRQADGLIWYTWDNVNSWSGLDLYNADGQRDARMDAIKEISTYR